MFDWGKAALYLADAILWMLACGFAVCVVLMAMFTYYSVRDYVRSKDKQDLEQAAIGLLFLAIMMLFTGILIFFSIKLVS